MVRILNEIGVLKMKPVTLHCDNQSASHISGNPVFADVFTKVLPSTQFNLLLSKLGMCSPMPSLRGDVEDSVADAPATKMIFLATTKDSLDNNNFP